MPNILDVHMNTSTGDIGDRMLRGITGAAMGLSAAAVALIVIFLLGSTWPLVASGEFLGVLLTQWRPYAEPGQYGIGAMVAGSLGLSLFAVALAFPLAIGICIFAHGAAPRTVRRGLLAVIHFMTSIPTVVYGFVAVCLLVPMVRQGFRTGTGYSLLSAGLVLAVLILPTIVLLIHVQLRQIAPTIKLGCAALGLTDVQTVVNVMLPAARRAIVSAVVLGFCRAIGDTLVALMIAGNAAQLPTSPLDSVRVLTAHIALVVATDWYSPEYRSVAAAGLLLFVLTGGLTLVMRRWGERWGGS